MSKSTAKKRVAESSTVSRKARPGSQVVTPNAQPSESLPSQFVQEVMSELPGAFASQEQAIEFVLNKVTGRMGSNEAERAQMHEFLSLVLDTDPSLKEEILAGMSIGK